MQINYSDLIIKKKIYSDWMCGLYEHQWHLTSVVPFSKNQDSELRNSTLFRFLTAYLIIHEVIQLAAWKHSKNILIVLEVSYACFMDNHMGKF